MKRGAGVIGVGFSVGGFPLVFEAATCPSSLRFTYGIRLSLSIQEWTQWFVVGVVWVSGIVEIQGIGPRGEARARQGGLSGVTG